MQAPVHVLQTNAKRESGRKAQLNNIMAGKAVAKPWQLTKPPKFGPKPKEDKLTLPPYPKPHTLG